ncbi:MAG TPA: universal stress protein [Jatrophihabitantaceae bacterium]
MANSSDVVVGIDDSSASVTALYRAASEAALRGVGLRAIHVWHYPSTWGVPLKWPAGANPGQFVLQRLTEVVDRAQAARSEAGEPVVNISVEVIEGDTEHELRAAAENAPMLVLSQRHRRGPAAILGAVSSALAAHPPCPVLIVPAEDHR